MPFFRPQMRAFLVLTAMVAVFVPAPREAQSGPQGNPLGIRARLLWSTAANVLRSAAFTATGNHLCLVRPDGSVTLYTRSGARLFSTIVDKATAALPTPDLTRTIVYSRKNPTHREITFLDSAGRVDWRTTVAGAPWCADGAEVDGGARFAVGTGSGHVYLFDVGAGRKRYRRWRAPGVVVSIAIDSTGKGVTFGTWQRSTVSRMNSKGRVLWRADLNRSELQQVAALAVESRVFARGAPNAAGASGTYRVMSGSGRTIHSGKTAAGASGVAICSPNASYLCLGDSKAIRHKGKSALEESAELIGPSGRRIWRKGSIFFPARPLMVTSRGTVIVSDGKQGILAIDSAGSIRTLLKMPCAVAGSIAARNGSALALRCSDGRLRVVSVEQ